MKREDAARELEFAAQACSDAGRGHAVLKNVLLHVGDGVISVASSDGDVTVRTKIDAEVKQAPSEVVMVPGRVLADALAAMEGERVELRGLDGKEGRLVVACGKSVIRIACSPDASSYPTLPTLDDESEREATNVSSVALRAAFRLTKPVASHATSGFDLRCAQLTMGQGRVLVYATDGARLARAVETSSTLKKVKKDRLVLVPVRAMSMIDSITPDQDEDHGDVVTVIDVGGRFVCFQSRADDRMLFARHPEVKFPDCNSALPPDQDDDCSCLVDRTALDAALKRAALMAASRGESTVLLGPVTKQGLSAALTNPDLGATAEDVAVDDYTRGGEPGVIHVAISFMVDAVRALRQHDTLSLRWRPDGKMITVRPNDEELGSMVVIAGVSR